MPPMSKKKTTLCAWCNEPFEMTRYDSRFCSKQHGRNFHNAQADWKRRKDRITQNEKRRKRYHANKEVVLAKQREFRKNNQEIVREKDCAEYQRNKQKHFERAKRYRAEHPEKRNLEYKRSREKYPWLHSLLNARNRSLKKKFSFDLTREWCVQNWTGKCAVTGLDFVFGTQTHFPFAPSIDRIDSSKGYLQTNCRFVLFAVNSLKGTGTDEQMIQIAQAIVNLHQKAALPMLYIQAPETDFAQIGS